ncbi:beta-N-acetylhexosaminidase [Microvirga lotononidis]|uniref:beta-N-acetylhexosaminidase n=1 Tax=Microvirga lotononidis TaxID=864069 RepID=I4YX11_9HYPH|nr:beta-N-acetylhexosaminidase [Microvirga lotononidis]EIM28503.1 beta-glucosidase-like glycosyl hydrolase [Microvirga lotononidis]WQO27425.1 beta-N-acetylhexosaminidase [Microvirga lotononidis]
MNTRAFIAGCSGTELTLDEASFFKEADPWGFILFRRNVESPEQVRALCAALRDAVGRSDAPILIDQEGGRVQRLGPPHWPKYPSGRTYGRLHANDPLVQREIARLGARLIAHDLRSVGITVDCLPVLDVPSPGAHDVIGDRAYGPTPSQVAILGRAAAEGLLAGGVLPVVKHMPGHGRAGADSHLALPVVDASRDELERHDFAPFRMLTDMPLAMTAHVVYTALDPERPATTSPVVMQDIIRGHIGYDGLVMTDDLSMHALSGSFRDRTEAAFAAGCDMALHCNGNMEEMRAVAEAAPILGGEALRRANAALARITHDPEPLDPVDARSRLDSALAMIA